MERLLKNSARLDLTFCHAELKALIKKKREHLDTAPGNIHRFGEVIAQLPPYSPSWIDLDQSAVQAGDSSDLTRTQAEALKDLLKQVGPWRKGPFNLFGIHIDSEWQSWMKWDRLSSHINPLGGARILDIGSSNGYYMFRMAAQNPEMVLGLEPQSNFYFQYLALQKYLNQPAVFSLPITFEEFPRPAKYFDSVFLMGVLYHRNSPLTMLKEIHDIMKPGGQLVLENLIIETRQGMCLFPENRYAKMRNVFFIPDLAAMESWLLRCGFKDVRCVDITRTEHEEQRKTDWIQTESLKDFLDPDDPQKTVEGYPAPVRAIFTTTA